MPDTSGIPRDDAAIFSLNSVGEKVDDTEDPEVEKPRLLRTHTERQAITNGSFPDEGLYNLTPGAKQIP